MIKEENNRVKLGKNTLRMFVDKNAILSWEWARVIVRIRCDRGAPRFQKLAFNFQKTQYCVTVSISYSRVCLQEPLILIELTL